MSVIKPAAMNDRGAVAYTNLGKTTLWRLVAEGKIEVKRVGRRTLFMRESLDAFLASLPSNKITA